MTFFLFFCFSKFNIFAKQGLSSSSRKCLWAAPPSIWPECPCRKRPFPLHRILMLFFLELLEGTRYTSNIYEKLGQFFIVNCFLNLNLLDHLIWRYKWDNNEKHLKPETGLLQLRAGLRVFANLRPATVFPQVKYLSWVCWSYPYVL